MSTAAPLAVEASTLLGFATAYAAMLVTPGPSFLIVSQASCSSSRREAGLVAVGVACGASLLIMVVLYGAANLPASTVTESTGRLIGALLLLVIGLRAIRRAVLPTMPADIARRHGRTKGHFLLGLVTALTNPISLAFFSSVALAAGSAQARTVNALLPASVFVMALCWFGCLAMLFSLPSVKRLYGRSAGRLDGASGVLLIVIALLWLSAAG